MKKAFVVVSVTINILLIVLFALLLLGRSKPRTVTVASNNKVKVAAKVVLGGATVQNTTSLAIYDMYDKPKVLIDIMNSCDSIDVQFKDNSILFSLIGIYKGRVIGVDTFEMIIPKRYLEVK